MNKYILSLFLLFASHVVFSQVKKAVKTEDGHAVYSCPIVEKPFINKIGEASEHKELYMRCSIQDYFIKFCESTVSEDELRPFLGKGIRVAAEIVEGNWDVCPDDPAHMQSRTGDYIIIHKVLDQE